MTDSPAEYIPCILFVDDEKPILKALGRFSRDKPWTYKTASSGAEGIAILEGNTQIDVVVSDMRMPGMSGSDFLIHVRENYPQIIRILLTGFSDVSALESAINKGRIYNYISKPWDDYLLSEVLAGALRLQTTEREKKRLEELTRKQHRQLGILALSLDKQVKERTIEIEQAMTLLQMTHDKLQNNFLDSLSVLNQVLEWKEGHDSGHSRFVTEYTGKILDRLSLDRTESDDIGIAARLHRLGLIGLPDNIRNRPQYGLNNEEKALYQQHPMWAEVALSVSTGLAGASRIIRHQLEYVNGTGKPDGMTDKEIPTGSKIIGVLSDFYQVYDGRLEDNISGLEQAIEYIELWTGKRYDTEIVKILREELEGFVESKGKAMVVTADKLEGGMLLDEDIITKGGLVLLGKGAVLNELNIHKLTDYEAKYGERFNISVMRPE